MKYKDTYENHYLKDIVNLISKEHCPAKFPMHWHKYVEILTVLNESKEENIKVKVNYEEYILHKGDVLFVWPGELHEIMDNSVKQLVAIQFPMAVISEVHDFTSYMNIFKGIHLINEHENPELSENLSKLLTKLDFLKEQKKPFIGVHSLIGLYEVFMSLGEQFVKEVENNTYFGINSAQMMEKIQGACSYIQENCDQDLSLDEVSRLCGFSSYYFSRCFKRVTTVNFVEYLATQRIKRVQLLLIDTDLSITEVAYQAGFRSLSTFNRVFRQFNGCSPSEYKRYYNEE